MKPIHQINPDTRPDHEFLPGTLELLAEGNACRLRDRRRTPGRIESISAESGYFRWRILDFEDKGKFWDVQIEDVNKFQFEIDSRKESPAIINDYERLIRKFQTQLVIDASTAESDAIGKCLAERTVEIQNWLRTRQRFSEFSFETDVQEISMHALAALQDYMNLRGLAEQERLTSEIYVLNPHSGEWIKGMKIVLAEMGLKKFSGSIVRDRNLFLGVGDKRHRRAYLLERLAFVRALFKLLGKSHVRLFRGASVEGPWRVGAPKFFSSWTFSKAVAESFCCFDSDSGTAHSYLFMRTFPVEKLLMTFLETESMNRQYCEAEAVLMHDEEDGLLW